MNDGRTVPADLPARHQDRGDDGEGLATQFDTVPSDAQRPLGHCIAVSVSAGEGCRLQLSPPRGDRNSAQTLLAVIETSGILPSPGRWLRCATREDVPIGTSGKVNLPPLPGLSELLPPGAP